jgi:sugar lactone lactonase YvrE
MQREPFAYWVLSAFLLATLAARPSVAQPRYPLRVESWPAGARVEVQAADGTQLKGRAPWARRLPAGRTRIAASLRRHRPWSETVELQGRTAVTACLDPEDQLVRCQRLIPCGLRPKSVVLSPDGSVVWVAILWGPTSLQVFETATGKKLEQLSLAKHGATELELSADRSKVYVSQMATGQVHELDFKTRKLLRTFETKGSWTKVIKLSADGKTLFASNWVSSDISVVDLESGVLRRKIRTVRKPRGMYPTRDNRYLYVAGFKHGELAKVDLQTGRGVVIYDKGISLRHIVADERRRRLYISDIGRNHILTLDLDTDKLRLFARTNNKPNTMDLGPGGRVLFVSHRGARGDVKYTEPGPEWGSVLLFDTESGKILDAIVGGNQPTALDVSDDGRVLVFSDFLDNRLRVYRVPPHEELVTGKGGRARSHLRDLPKPKKEPPATEKEAPATDR